MWGAEKGEEVRIDGNLGRRRKKSIDGKVRKGEEDNEEGIDGEKGVMGKGG